MRVPVAEHGMKTFGNASDGDYNDSVSWQQDPATTEIFTDCRNDIPTAAELLTAIPFWYFILIAIYAALSLLILVIYVEEIHFLAKHFRKGARQKKTVWILAFFPVFTIVSYLAVLVPRSGTLCDLVSNVFFVTCLYQFVGLMENYIGGREKLLKILEESREISINTPPCCCCCVCLPKLKLNGRRYARLSWYVTQVIIVRPLLMFISAVLWTNGSYIPGNLEPSNAFLYIALLNLASTLFAMWGLMVLKRALDDDLEPRFVITGKIRCIQLCLISSSVPNIIVGILVTTDVIACNAIYPSKARADAIYHGIMVVLMPIYGILARRFFRRKEDADRSPEETTEGLLKGPDPVPSNSRPPLHSLNPDNGDASLNLISPLESPA